MRRRADKVRKRVRIAHLFVPHESNDRRPHALRETTVLLSLAFVLILQIGFLAYEVTLFRSGPSIAAVLPSAIALLTNEARADVSAEPLTVSSVLTDAAQKKAEDMAKGGYFAHQEPNGQMPWHWFKEEGYNYRYAGENLAVNFSDTELLMNAWLASPTHRGNIVKPEYRDIGIGMATGTYKGREAVFVVQFFGSRHADKNLDFVSPNMDLRSPYIEEPSRVAATTSTTLAVLGEETSNVKEPMSAWQKITTSPRTMNMRLLIGLAAVFLGILGLSLIPRFRAHPHAIRNGFVALAILAFFFAFQSSFLGSVEVPKDSQASTAATSFLP